MKQESKVIFEKINEEKDGKLNQVELAKEVEPEDKAEGSEPEEAAMEEGAEEDNMEAGADGDEEPKAEVSAREGGAEEDDVEASANDDEAFSAANANDDEALSAPESFLQHVADEDDAEAAEQMANQMMEDLDLDKDGQLSLAEFAAGEQAEAADAEDKE